MSRALKDLVRELVLVVIATGRSTAHSRELVARAEQALRPAKRVAPRRRPVGGRKVAPESSARPPEQRPRLIGRGKCACGRLGNLFHSEHGPACATCIRGDGEGY